MKKRKNVVIYDQEYIDRLEEFNEYLMNGMPELDAEKYEDEEEDEESVWIITESYEYNQECRSRDILGAFRTEAEAKCYLRQIKHEMNNSYKCYSSYGYMKAIYRSNKKIVKYFAIIKTYYL